MSVNFMVLDSGVVGFMFQYLDENRYYALELGMSYIKFLKIYDDVESTLGYQ